MSQTGNPEERSAGPRPIRQPAVLTKQLCLPWERDQMEQSNQAGLPPRELREPGSGEPRPQNQFQNPERSQCAALYMRPSPRHKRPRPVETAPSRGPEPNKAAARLRLEPRCDLLVTSFSFYPTALGREDPNPNWMKNTLEIASRPDGQANGLRCNAALSAVQMHSTQPLANLLPFVRPCMGRNLAGDLQHERAGRIACQFPRYLGAANAQSQRNGHRSTRMMLQARAVRGQQ
jgi:hypothetical protein